MSDVRIFDDTNALAEAAATHAVEILQATLNDYDSAVWVLAGGTAPLAAYKVIADKHHDALEWTKVTAVIGDERIGPLDGPDNNWHAIDQILSGLPLTRLRPNSDTSADEAAADYEQQLLGLPKADNGLPRLDLVWLGVGQDGHTLSLFPNHASLLPSAHLVIAVHDAPKPPADRISLTLRALQGAQNVMILTSGNDKQAAVMIGTTTANSPVGLVASIVTTHEGKVSWFVDKDAAPTD